MIFISSVMAFVDCEVLHYHPQKIVHLNNLKKTT